MPSHSEKGWVTCASCGPSGNLMLDTYANKLCLLIHRCVRFSAVGIYVILRVASLCHFVQSLFCGMRSRGQEGSSLRHGHSRSHSWSRQSCPSEIPMSCVKWHLGWSVTRQSQGTSERGDGRDCPQLWVASHPSCAPCLTGSSGLAQLGTLLLSLAFSMWPRSCP